VVRIGMRCRAVGRLCLDDQITTMLRPAGGGRGGVGRDGQRDPQERAFRGINGWCGMGVVHDVVILGLRSRVQAIGA
jgi:hypothetical protein